MTDETETKKALEKLEALVELAEGVLTICSWDKNCGKLRIDLDGSEVWIERSANPVLYDRVLEHYNALAISSRGKNGVSHGMCPEHYRKVNDDLDKHEV